MPSPRVDLLLEGRIQQLLDMGKTYEYITNKIENDTGQQISLKKIYKVKQRKEQGKENWSPKRRKPHKITDDMKQLKRIALFKNLPTQDRMAAILGVSQQSTELYSINCI